MNSKDMEPKCAFVPKPVKLLVTIVERGKGEKITELYWKYGITFHLICLGRGTADSDILAYLGLGETEKDVVLSVVLESRADEIMKLLRDEMKFDKPGQGIAFTIPVGSVDGSAALRYISGFLQNKEG